MSALVTSAPTHRVQIYMAGDVETAHRVIREWCYQTGACFTVTPTKYIYTGGEESGFVVGLINYPRFRSTRDELALTAYNLALKLMPACNQRSCTVVDDVESRWITLDPPGAPS